MKFRRNLSGLSENPRILAGNFTNSLLLPRGGEYRGAKTPIRPGMRKRLEVAGRATIEVGYRFAVRMEKVRRVYDDLCADPRPGRMSRGMYRS